MFAKLDTIETAHSYVYMCGRKALCVVDPCLINNGGCEGICAVDQGNVTCKCLGGQMLVGSTQCRREYIFLYGNTSIT